MNCKLFNENISWEQEYKTHMIHQMCKKLGNIKVFFTIIWSQAKE